MSKIKREWTWGWEGAGWGVGGLFILSGFDVRPMRRGQASFGFGGVIQSDSARDETDEM